MLNQRKSILEACPPLLITMSDGSWHLVTRVQTSASQGFEYECVKQTGNALEPYRLHLSEDPFHIGADIWELEYGVQIMTLMDASLETHPANSVWESWKQSAHA